MFFTEGDEIKSNSSVVKRRKTQRRETRGVGAKPRRDELSSTEKLAFLITRPPIIFLISLINDARCPTFLNRGSHCRTCPKGRVLLTGTADCASRVRRLMVLVCDCKSLSIFPLSVSDPVFLGLQ